MNRVAVSIIVGDGQDKEKWDALIGSVYIYVDHIYVSYNGKEENFPYSSFTKMTVAHHEWPDDFAVARNNAFDMIPLDEYEWIMWLDADDTLVNGSALFRVLESATEQKLHQVFLPYIYASDPIDGTPRVTQWRERILSTRVPWRWYYSIHEVCHTQPGSKSGNMDEVFVLHHRDVDPFSHKATRTRNRRILGRALELAPDEPRYIYYQANELFAEAYYLFEQQDDTCAQYFKDAIKLYQRYGQTSPSSDDAYIANYRIGDALRMIGEWPRAIDTAMQGIKIRPRWPDSWMLATHSMFGMKEWEAAAEFASIAIQICEQPQTNQISEPLTLHYTPYALRALCYTEMGRYEEALEDYDVALKFWDNPILAGKRAEAIRRRDGVELKNADRIRKTTFGKKPDKSIVFLTRPLPEAWNPTTLAGGSGGAEWCVHEIARRFKSDGYRAAIFGTPGEERGVDSEGVEWWDSADYDPNEEFTHVVAVRAPEVFDTPLKARKSKILWGHDVNMGGKEVMTSPWGNRFDNPDHIICLTEWHKHRWERTYGVKSEKISVIGNGINLSDYPEWTEQRIKNKFIYASSPDRGIDTLLQMWPTIKDRIPDAQLHVYYGWNMLDSIVKQSGGRSPLAEYKSGVVALYESVKHLDVEWHNRVSRAELQKIETTCDAWLYPTHFLETFCITALETAMNGVLPLVNPIGALQEVVPDSNYHVAGMPNHPNYFEKYVDRLATIHEGLNGDREQHREWASRLTWDHRFDQWKEMLNG